MVEMLWIYAHCPIVNNLVLFIYNMYIYNIHRIQLPPKNRHLGNSLKGEGPQFCVLVKLYNPIASYKWDEIVLATSDISLAPATSDILRKRVFFPASFNCEL